MSMQRVPDVHDDDIEKQSWSLTNLIARRLVFDSPRIAVIDGDTSYSYGDIARKVSELAHALKLNGVGAEDRVVVSLERGVDLLVSILAIIAAGGTYVPVDPNAPPERKKYIIDDVDAVLILDAECLVELKSSAPEDVRYVVQAASRPADAAYIMYTSGSTGKPKGVVVEHRQVIEFLNAAFKVFNFDENDSWALFHSYAFDLSIWEMWGGLWSQGRLIVVSYETARSPSAMSALIRKSGITMLMQTPSSFSVLRDSIIGSAHSLRYLFFCGEALDLRILEPWFDFYEDSGPKIVNTYGITETTVLTTYKFIDRSTMGKLGSPIGFPLSGMPMCIVNDALETAKPNELGELLIMGNGLARGYYGRKDLTDERFVYIQGDYGKKIRAYRTGDYGYIADNGEFEFSGRRDDQVKIRGFRVELPEVENALESCPGVSMARVVLAQLEDENRRIFAFIISPDAAMNHNKLVADLSTKIPSYALPSRYEYVAELPVNVNGKTDRQLLRARANALLSEGVMLNVENHGETFSSEIASSELVKDIKRRLRAVWYEVLKCRPSDATDFFMLGGDSIDAARLIQRIGTEILNEYAPLKAEQLKSSLLNAFYQKPTLNTLIEFCESLDTMVSDLRDASMVQISPGLRCVSKGGKHLPPVFIFHGVLQGEALYPSRIAELLGPAHSVYSFAPHGTNGEQVPSSLHEMALDYLTQIEKIQPAAPYHLVGYCNGGILAFEIAQILENKGKAIPTLILLCTAGDANIRFQRIRRWILHSRLMRRKSIDVREKIFKALKKVLLRCEDLSSKIWVIRQCIESASALNTERPSQMSLNQYRSLCNNIDVYIPKYYSGHVALIAGKDDRLVTPRQLEEQWTLLASSITLDVVPGGHEITEMHIERIMHHLQENMSIGTDSEQATGK